MKEIQYLYILLLYELEIEREIFTLYMDGEAISA